MMVHRLSRMLVCSTLAGLMVVPSTVSARGIVIVAPEQVSSETPSSPTVVLERARAAFDAGRYLVAIADYESLRRDLPPGPGAAELRLRVTFGLAAAYVGAFDQSQREDHLDRAVALLSDLRARVLLEYAARTAELMPRIEDHLQQISARRPQMPAEGGREPTPVPAPTVQPAPPRAQPSQAAADSVLHGRALIRRGRAMRAGGGASLAVVPVGLVTFMVGGIVRAVAGTRLRLRRYDDRADFDESVHTYGASGKIAFAGLVSAVGILPVSISLLAAGSSLKRRGQTMTLQADRHGFAAGWSQRF